MEQFLALMKSIEARPVMHGVEKVEDIALIIYGFGNALQLDERRVHDEFLSNFRQYVNAHFKTAPESSFVKLIRFYSGGDAHSVQLFFDLFNEWLKTHRGMT